MTKNNEIMAKINELIAQPDDLPGVQLDDETILTRLHTIALSLDNQKGLIEQNRALQTELLSSIKIVWNDVNDVNFGAFVLKRYSWFSFLNTTEGIGFVDVEYKSDKHRCIYIGIAAGKDFNVDVLNIAQYGTRIKDLGYAE